MTTASPAQAAFLRAILSHSDGYKVPAHKVFGRRGRPVVHRTPTIKSCVRRGWAWRDDRNGRAYWSVTTEGRLAIGVSPVGPDGCGSWVHTDGRTYLHDPATSTYKRYDQMVPGDIIDWAGRAPAEVLRVNEPYTHPCGPLAGRVARAHWCRRLSDGVEGHVPFGPDGSAPVRHPQPAGR